MLLRHRYAGPAHFSRVVLQFRKTILHRQHRLRVIDVDIWGESHSRNSSRIDIDQAPKRMVGHQMSTALRAVLPVASLRFHEVPDELAPFVTFTFSGFHSVNAFTGAADQERQESQWQ